MSQDPMAWVGNDFTGDEDLVYRLMPATVAALEELLERTRELPRDEITRADVGHPDVDGPAREVYEELIRGRGLVVVRGLPVEGHTIEENERLFWCWLSHFGELLSNNSFGHRMVRVQQEVMPGGVQPARGTKSAAELAMHNDSSDLFSLLWIHQAEEGGESQFSSGPAAYATIEATRPDILPILRRGFPHHRRSEQPDHQPDVTPYDVPIFSDIDGRIAINFTYSSILPALHVLGRELTPEEDEALEILRRVLVEQQVELRMQPGDASMANNYAMRHSRSDFVDGPDPERRRLVLRAWNEVPTEDRRLPVGREYFLMENQGGRLGYDMVPGREGRIANNDYSNVDEGLADLFKAAQAKPKLGWLVRAHLVYFDQWTDPVAGEILGDDGSVDVTRLEITGDVDANWAGLERAHGYQSLIRTELARRPGVAEQWICGPDLLARCPDLLAVCSAGAGYDIVDVEACTAAGVIVCNNSGPGREAVAEHALGFMLTLAKKISLADRMIRRDRIQDRSALRSSELLGKTLGIVGVGQIGGRLIELCAPFAMDVLAFDPYLSDDEATARGATKVELDELLARSDFVQLNCPLTPETEGLIGREQFALMKPTAFFITTARGPVHDEAALYDALVDGTIAGAGIDVFHDEPPDPSHPLLSLDNVVASPHTAGITIEATRDIAIATAEQWITIFGGKVPPRLLNPEAWPTYSDRFDARFGVRPEEPVQ